MTTARLDFSLFDRFDFENKPVGIKFTLKKPEDIVPLKKELAICEMFREAQTSEPFYADRATTQCGEYVVNERIDLFSMCLAVFISLHVGRT